MSWKKILNLETILMITITVFLASSVINYLDHEPRWMLLLGPGLAAVFFFARPKTALLLLFFLSTAYLSAAHYFEALAREILLFADNFQAELQAWGGIYDFPGELLTITMALPIIFVLVYLQLHLISKDQNDWPLILLGFMVYLWLWFQRYPRAETDLIIFFTLAFPLSALLYARTRNQKILLSYKTGLLSLGVLCSLLVIFAPYQSPVYYDDVFAYLRSNLPALQSLQREADEISWSFPGTAQVIPGTERQVGYSPGGELGGGLTNSTQPVLDVQLLEGALPRSLYLRGRASDYYTGRSWQTSDLGTAADLETAFRDSSVYHNEVKLQVSYLRPEEDLFGLFPTTAVEILDEEPTSLEYRLDIMGNIRVHPESFTGTYALTGKTITPVDLRTREHRPELVKDSTRLSPFLQLPPELPQRLRELAGEITAGAETELEKVEKIKDYLKQFPYRTDTPGPPAEEDFVDHFLFEQQEGYCSYYASAMAVLLRTQEIPARYVLGYRVPVDNHQEALPGTDSSTPLIQVRQNHAHAWVEVFLQGHGWVAFEPTQPYEILGTMEDGAAEDPEESPAEDFQEVEGDPADRELGEEHSAEVDESEEMEGAEETETAAEQETVMDGDTTEEERDGAPGTENGGAPGDETTRTETSSTEADSEHNFPLGGWLFILLGTFSIGSWYVYQEFSYAKNPVDLYRKIIRLRSFFQQAPRPGETPGQIIAHLQQELPELAEDFEHMKDSYHLSYYSTRKEAAVEYGENLRTLPFKTARLYLQKRGLLHLARNLLGTFKNPEKPPRA